MNTEITGDNPRLQNYTGAIRQMMGLPPHQPANDLVGFVFGPIIDDPISASAIGRYARDQKQDVIHLGFAHANASTPAAMMIAWRKLDCVEMIGGCVPYCTDANSPIMLVEPRSCTCFAVDERGSLVRTQRVLHNLAAGKRMAMHRIKQAAADLGKDQASPTITMTAGSTLARKHREPPIVLFT